MLINHFMARYLHGSTHSKNIIPNKTKRVKIDKFLSYPAHMQGDRF